MRIMLFDWTTGGHHAAYLRRFAEVLSDKAQVVAAVPDEMTPALKGTSARFHSLGASRPSLDYRAPLPPQNKALAERELALFDRAIDEVRPHHVLHLYADPILRRLVLRPAYPCKVTLCIFFPRAHYPSVYATPLTIDEQARAWFQEYLVWRWRRRPDAHVLFTLDEAAASRWTESAVGRAEAHWMPEPPVLAAPPQPAAQREGCIVYGALAPRKGLDLLAEAVTPEVGPLAVRIAGAVQPGFEADLTRLAARMCSSGASVTVEPWHHTDEEGLAALASASCAVLPYPKHYTMSRVMLEAAYVGTPVVVHDRGMLGHLVRRFKIGIAVDCTNKLAFQGALREMCASPGRSAEYAPALARFAARYSPEAFHQAVTRPFHHAGRSPSAGSRMMRPSDRIVRPLPPESPETSSL